MTGKEKIAAALKKAIKKDPKASVDFKEYYRAHPHQLALRDQVAKELSEKHGLSEKQIDKALSVAERALDDLLVDDYIDHIILGTEQKTNKELIELATLKFTVELMDFNPDLADKFVDDLDDLFNDPFKED